MFVGRLAQLDRLAQVARASSLGRLNVGYLSGERGIGKTSFATFLRTFLQRDFGVLGVHVFMSGATTLEEALYRIFDQILRAARTHVGAREIRDLVQQSLNSIGIVGVDVALRPSDRELAAIGANFDVIVSAMMKNLPQFQSMLLVLDDINELAPSQEFGHWLKTFVDTASTSGSEPPLFMLVCGTEESRRMLTAGNESLVRILASEMIEPWTDGEAEEFYREAFAVAERPVTPDALRAMIALTNGRPSTAHKLGDAALKSDRDGHITEEDALAALQALQDEQGALRPPRPAEGAELVTPVVPPAQRRPSGIRVLRSITG